MSASLYQKNVLYSPGEVVRELMNVAQRAGIEVRVEPLDPEIFARHRGGICRIEGAQTILVDSTASNEEKMAVLLNALGSVELDAIYMRPQLRERIERQKGYVKRA
jgi:hypothetical protein